MNNVTAPVNGTVTVATFEVIDRPLASTEVRLMRAAFQHDSTSKKFAVTLATSIGAEEKMAPAVAGLYCALRSAVAPAEARLLLKERGASILAESRGK